MVKCNTSDWCVRVSMRQIRAKKMRQPNENDVNFSVNYPKYYETQPTNRKDGAKLVDTFGTKYFG